MNSVKWSGKLEDRRKNMTNASDAENLRHTALLTLYNTCSLLTRYSDRVLNSGASISYQQFLVLLTIASLKPPVSQTDLAKKIQRELNSVSMIIDRMEASGLVTRTRSIIDRRAVHLKITHAGRKLLGQGVTVNETLINKLTGVLSNKEIETVTRLLTKLQEQLIKELGEEVPNSKKA
jgi:DNA-binding MarR family transcriptional regulator